MFNYVVVIYFVETLLFFVSINSGISFGKMLLLVNIWFNVDVKIFSTMPKLCYVVSKHLKIHTGIAREQTVLVMQIGLG